VNNIPGWWETLLLALAAWRSYRLLAEDTILNRPRRWLLRLDPEWEEGSDPNPDYRFAWGSWLTCPYCAGAWVALGWWAAWLVWPHATVLISVPLALNAALIAAAKLDE
jgi:Protein of unknown function (DUF1360)